MEKVPPSKIVKAQLPPAEPPPSLENKEEETQWIQDTTTMANKILRHKVLGKITVLSSSNYKKAHNIDPIDQEIQDYMLEKLIKQNTENRKERAQYRTSHPQPNYLSIPTPKQKRNYYILDNSFTQSNWQDSESIKWMKTKEDTWDVPNDIGQNHNTDDMNSETIADKWDAMIQDHNPKKICTMKHKINICTDTIQNDTGANKAVTNNNSLLYNYKTIAPYPIGGVKADDVAITCTGEGFLPWKQREGNIIWVKTMFSKEVDGTIISPTTVVEQNRDTFQGFTIEANCDNGAGMLKFLNRDGVNHNTVSMTLENGLWFHNY